MFNIEDSSDSCGKEKKKRSVSLILLEMNHDQY